MGGGRSQSCRGGLCALLLACGSRLVARPGFAAHFGRHHLQAHPLAMSLTSINSFHPALKYTWEISETSLAFLDIKVSISGNGLCTSVHYKPTDSQLFVTFIVTSITCQELHSLFSISFFRRLCSDDFDFSSKSEEMCQLFEKRGYPVSVVKAGLYRAQ